MTQVIPTEFRSFANGEGRITRLPVRLSKKIALSKWLLCLVEPGRRYSEKEISDLFEQYVDDFALMRRMLVESGDLGRERDCSAYWLVTSKPAEEPVVV